METALWNFAPLSEWAISYPFTGWRTMEMYDTYFDLDG